jgi:hypothetical protein
MTSERQFDTLLLSWLEESAPSGQPQALLESVLTATGHTRPRPAWLVRLHGEPMPDTGRPGLNRFAPFGLAATAIVVALLIGIGLILRSPNVGPSPVPGPTHQATPEPTEQRAAAWTATRNMNEARSGHSATLLLDGKVLVAGGGSAELYDPASGTWTATGNMIRIGGEHTATLLTDGNVLVVAAGTGEDVDTSAELYDPASGTWTATGNMIQSFHRHGFTATRLLDGTVLVAGGTPAGESAELYDPSSGTWRATGNMIEGRAWHAATLLPDGKVLVAVGTSSTCGPASCGSELALASAELYDPASGTWSVTGRMSESRGYIAATLLRNGAVLVAGGGAVNDLGIQPLASAELYDPASGTWSVTGSMSEARGRLVTYTLLPAGTVLAVGGLAAGGAAYSASAELYDPGSGTWTSTASMHSARRDHTATLLSDGRVLVVGGYNSADASGTYIPLALAELYEPGSGT